MASSSSTFSLTGTTAGVVALLTLGLRHTPSHLPLRRGYPVARRRGDPRPQRGALRRDGLPAAMAAAPRPAAPTNSPTALNTD